MQRRLDALLPLVCLMGCSELQFPSQTARQCANNLLWFCMLCKNFECHFLPTLYILTSSLVHPPPRPPVASNTAIVESSYIQHAAPASSRWLTKQALCAQFSVHWGLC